MTKIEKSWQVPNRLFGQRVPLPKDVCGNFINSANRISSVDNNDLKGKDLESELFSTEEAEGVSIPVPQMS
jgi:hypothetical protein